ncbi:UNVERIFIED_CONTAM: hypothetical protein K2H54_011651 [Gekko kuhli]
MPRRSIEVAKRVSPPQLQLLTMTGVLKRKYDELEDDAPYSSSSSSSSPSSSSSASSGWDSDEENSRGDAKPGPVLNADFTRKYGRLCGVALAGCPVERCGSQR